MRAERQSSLPVGIIFARKTKAPVSALALIVHRVSVARGDGRDTVVP